MDLTPAIIIPPALPPVPQFSDLVRATQYGKFEECRHLLETKLFDVNQRDSENVSLLHWAAINNLSQIVDYYLSKGADINAIGGDLKSTPLHWAVRQGHLSMVVQLVRRGADLSIFDGEGCNCLHLAAQFGHTAIVAYLIAKGVDINLPDSNGMTALMWSAYRVTNVDPTRLLLTLGAGLSTVDIKHRNTALHWAVYARNLTTITLLLKAKASVEVLNANDESPLDMARKYQNHWLVKMLESHLTKQPTNNHPIIRALQNKTVVNTVKYIAPSILYWTFAAILDSHAVVVIKAIFLILLTILTMIFSRPLFDHTDPNSLPVAIYLTVKFWLHYTILVHLLPCEYCI